MPGGLGTATRTREGFPPTRLDTVGMRIETGAYVTAALALGETVVAAHGDGRLRLFSGDAAPLEVAAHRGGILAMARDGETSVVTGGDDGRFCSVSLDGAVQELADFGSRWVDSVAAHGPAGLRACSVGRTVHVWSSDDGKAESFEHPSTVGGLAFDGKGRRLAVAHYGGVTLWERGERRWRSKKLVWAGSHIGVTWSPDDRYVVTVMQENALHGWRLRDKADMQMVGYPAKPLAFDWAGDAPHLATSGADQAICWPFDGKSGPMGRDPLCIAYGGKQLTTCVRALPGQQAVLAGFQDGAVLACDLEEGASSLLVRGTTGVEVTAIVVTSSLSRILIGDAGGGLVWAPLL